MGVRFGLGLQGEAMCLVVKMKGPSQADLDVNNTENNIGHRSRNIPVIRRQQHPLRKRGKTADLLRPVLLVPLVRRIDKPHLVISHNRVKRGHQSVGLLAVLLKVNDSLVFEIRTFEIELDVVKIELELVFGAVGLDLVDSGGECFDRVSCFLYPFVHLRNISDELEVVVDHVAFEDF
jgi:hypothetical protein